MPTQSVDFSAVQSISHNGQAVEKIEVVADALDKTLSVWDGFKRQLFKDDIQDKRKISFTLSRLKNNGETYNYTTRSYAFNDKFIGYFDLDGFAELLAMDILAHAPYQWTLSSLQQIKTTSTLKALAGRNANKRWAIHSTSDIFDLELNKNLYLVKVFEKGNFDDLYTRTAIWATPDSSAPYFLGQGARKMYKDSITN